MFLATWRIQSDQGVSWNQLASKKGSQKRYITFCSGAAGSFCLQCQTTASRTRSCWSKMMRRTMSSWFSWELCTFLSEFFFLQTILVKALVSVVIARCNLYRFPYSTSVHKIDLGSDVNQVGAKMEGSTGACERGLDSSGFERLARGFGIHSSWERQFHATDACLIVFALRHSHFETQCQLRSTPSNFLMRNW